MPIRSERLQGGITPTITNFFGDGLASLAAKANTISSPKYDVKTIADAVGVAGLISADKVTATQVSEVLSSLLGTPVPGLSTAVLDKIKSYPKDIGTLVSNTIDRAVKDITECLGSIGGGGSTLDLGALSLTGIALITCAVERNDDDMVSKLQLGLSGNGLSDAILSASAGVSASLGDIKSVAAVLPFLSNATLKQNLPELPNLVYGGLSIKSTRDITKGQEVLDRISDVYPDWSTPVGIGLTVPYTPTKTNQLAPLLPVSEPLDYRIVGELNQVQLMHALEGIY